MKCEAAKGNCNIEATEICYHKDWEGESDMLICEKHKKELLELQDDRPKILGENPYRFKEIK